MKLVLAAVGALRGPGLREAADEYLTRVGRYAELAEREVKEAGRIPEGPARRTEEARRLSGIIPDGARLVALAREGQPWSSRDLARHLDRWRVESRPIAVVIGGSTGLAPEFLLAADHRWSLGAVTLPHELARVIVLEQLYRAFTILRGEPYHKGA